MISENLFPYADTAVLLTAVEAMQGLGLPAFMTASRVYGKLGKFSIYLETDDVEKSLGRLCAVGFFTHQTDDLADAYYECSVSQFSQIQAEMSRKGGLPAKVAVLGTDGLCSAFANAAKQDPAPGTNRKTDPGSALPLTARVIEKLKPTVAPASDRIVPIDHNSDSYRRAVDALDRVVSEFKRDNGTEGFSPADKSQRIAELEASQRLLTSEQASVNVVSSTVLPALKWIGDKFAGGALANLAAIAINALRQWLGI